MRKKQNKKLNIAMLGHKVVPSRRGGIELVLTSLCPLLVSDGCRITCFNRSNSPVENEYCGTVKGGYYKGVRLKTVPALDVKGLAAVTSSHFAAFRAAVGPYNIVHFHAEGPCAAMWIPKLFGKKCIATVHGLDWKRDKWRGGPGAAFIHLGEWMCVKLADEIIVLNKENQQYFEEKYGRKTVLIPNGVDRPEIRAPKLITEKYGLEGNDYILSLSRLTREKGIHLLIEAYKKLDTDKKLVIAGPASDTDDYVASLKQMAAGDPDIIFTDFVSGETLDELYSNAYVYVLPSNLEGMPLSLLEAMAYGNAVVASDISEIAEVAEGHALLFKMGDSADLKAKLEELLKDLQRVEDMQKSSPAYILSKYNWADVAARTVELYKGLVK